MGKDTGLKFDVLHMRASVVQKAQMLFLASASKVVTGIVVGMTAGELSLSGIAVMDNNWCFRVVSATW